MKNYSVAEKSGTRDFITTTGICFAIYHLVFVGFAVTGNAGSPSAPPLVTAVLNGDLNAVKAMIATGADVNVSMKTGYTPLYWAVAMDNKDMIPLLLAKGADINVVSGDGRLLANGANINGRARHL